MNLSNKVNAIECVHFHVIRPASTQCVKPISLFPFEHFMTISCNFYHIKQNRSLLLRLVNVNVYECRKIIGIYFFLGGGHSGGYSVGKQFFLCNTHQLLNLNFIVGSAIFL